MMTWWFTTFMAPAIKQKVHSLPGVEYLYAVMSPDQLEIPAYITEYDMSVSVTKKCRAKFLLMLSIVFFQDKWFTILPTRSTNVKVLF